MEQLLSAANESLGLVSAIVGLVTAVPIFWTWYVVTLGRERRYRQWFDQIRRDVSDAPVILVVDLLPDKDMLPSVERFRQEHEDLRAVPDDRVFRINRDHATTPGDVPKLMDDIRRVSGDITRAGADVVHYFHGGPCAISALVGAELRNFRRVIIYQHNPNKGYENWGPLHHGWQ